MASAHALQSACQSQQVQGHKPLAAAAAVTGVVQVLVLAVVTNSSEPEAHSD